jgi:hypothetical protein
MVNIMPARDDLIDHWRPIMSSGTLIICFFLLFTFILMQLTITRYFDLEEQKLDLERQRLNVQAYHTNCSIELQAAQERAKALEIVMNSPVVNTTVTDFTTPERVKALEIILNSPVVETAVMGLLDTPKEASNTVTSLIEELIKRFNVNVNFSPKFSNTSDITPHQMITVISDAYEATLKSESNNTPLNTSKFAMVSTLRYVQVNLRNGTSVGGKLVHETPAFTTIVAMYTYDPDAYILDYRKGTPFYTKDPNRYIVEGNSGTISINNDLINALIDIQDPKTVLQEYQQELRDEEKIRSGGQ